MPSIEAHPSLHSFFHDHVERALQAHRVELTPRAEWYLVEMLATQTPEPIPPDEAFAIRLARTQQVPVSERARELRALGDMTLLVLGFFAESLRHGVDPDYYVTVGSSAYDQAGSLLRINAPRRELADTLGEMAERFPALVPVLSAVSEESAANGLDLLGLYERWLRTGSPVFKRRLSELGVIVPAEETHGLA